MYLFVSYIDLSASDVLGFIYQQVAHALFKGQSYVMFSNYTQWIVLSMTCSLMMSSLC